jgi:uncharacterized protein
MKVTIIGASGRLGAPILEETLKRGHQVTTIVRNPEKITTLSPLLTIVKADILKDDIAKIIRGHDAVISAYNAGWTNPNIYDDQINGVKAIISAVKKSGVKRLLFVGGAGSLEVAPGVQLIDTMKLPDIPKQGVLAVRETLHVLKKEDTLNWTFLSPPSNIVTGERTGKYRVGKDQLLRNEAGESRISTQDYAVAMIDELENPRHTRQRFTVAY